MTLPFWKRKLQLLLLVIPIAGCHSFIIAPSPRKVFLTRGFGETFGGMDEESNTNNQEQEQADGVGVLILSELCRLERAAFARMAAAFSPTAGHQLNLHDIQDVSVLSVDGSHMDLQAVLCEEDGCTAVVVPLEFPRSCNDDTKDEAEHLLLQECLLENVEELDEKADAILQEQDFKSSHYEELGEKERLWRELIATENLNFPSWWVPPGTSSSNPGMLEECDLLKSLLNEVDFQPEVQIMARSCLEEEDMLNADITYAAVLAVGPAGICARICLTTPERSDTQVREVSLPFPNSQQAKHPRELREAVFAMMETLVQ